jgi:hypothetical protein
MDERWRQDRGPRDPDRAQSVPDRASAAVRAPRAASAAARRHRHANANATASPSSLQGHLRPPARRPVSEIAAGEPRGPKSRRPLLWLPSLQNQYIPLTK